MPTPLREGIPDLTFIDEAGAPARPAPHHGRHGRAREHHLPRHHRGAPGPVLEAGLRASGPGADFHLGYSPERIDPGNTTYTLVNTPKVVSGIDAASLAKVQGFYDRIVDTHRAGDDARRRPSSPSSSRTPSGT